MATINGANYKAQYVTKPESKYPKGELAGRKRVLVERFVNAQQDDGTVVESGDVLVCGILPPNSMITDAKVYINDTMGSGAFKLGHAATTAEADGSTINANDDGIIASVSAAGDAVLARPTKASDALYVRFGSETTINLTATATATGITADIVVEIEYVSD